MELFGGTFSRRKNEKFEAEVRKAVGEGRWKRAVGLWKESTRLAKERIRAKEAGEAMYVSVLVWVLYVTDHLQGGCESQCGYTEEETEGRACTERV
jgi:hypothetical protein